MQLNDVIAKHHQTPHAGTRAASVEVNRLIVVYGLAGAVAAVASGSMLFLVRAVGEVLGSVTTLGGLDLAIHQLEDVLLGERRALRAYLPTAAASAA
jgi:hypothetical protein